MTRIHPTAVVDPKAELADGVEVGPHAVIDANVRVGAGTRIGPSAYLTGYTEIGLENTIGCGAVIGEAPQDVGFKGGVTRVRIGDRNVIREYATIHRGTAEGSETVIGNDVFLMATAHVAHNCRIADRAIVANGALLAGYVELGERAFVSGNVVVHQFVRIGRLAMIGGGARVSKDVPPFALVEGNSLVRALNVVGLRRAGLSSVVRNRIKEAYRTLYRRGLSHDEAMARLESEADLPELRELVAFLRGSKRGLCWMRGADEQGGDEA
ncbi:MAG: acyl-ACP--UDP-N-acetylglucosamine O-acyltransferase [Planctomycetota bacterium]